MAEAPTTEAAIAALRAMSVATPSGAPMAPSPRAGHRLGARRRTRGRAQGFALRTNMTPMIDVVFQLLVFFIATTRFAPEERVMAMDLARREAAPAPGGTGAAPKPSDPFRLDDESLRIAVTVGGEAEVGAPVRRRMNPEGLRAFLAAEIRLPGGRAGMFEPGFPVVIAPADGAPWEAAVETLDAVVAAGFRNVGFERRPGEAGATR